jgi:hypothetical protein
MAPILFYILQKKKGNDKKSCIFLQSLQFTSIEIYSSRITSILSFMKIGRLVQKFKWKNKRRSDLKSLRFNWERNYGEKLKLCLLWIKHHTIKTYAGSRGKTPCILNFSNPWTWVAGCAPWSLYPQGQKPHYKLGRTLSGFEVQSGQFGGKEHFSTIRESKSCLPAPQLAV